MVLPAPNLDDRCFQDLVDDAKRQIVNRCPEWTEHNVSDPGVTLIEAFAQMVDQLIYRLNRVPDRHYLKFLELIGVELRPPAAARGEVTFWLSAPQPQAVIVRAETEVATPRTDISDPVVFSTTEELSIPPCAFTAAASHPAGAEPADQTAELSRGFPCFSAAPAVGDALLVGLSNAVPSCVVVVRVGCPVAGVGIDPRRPPLVWEAWTGEGWTPCEVDRDETGGLNRPGDVVLHLPRGHEESMIARQRAGWLRCRLIPATAGQRTYTQSPRITALSAFTIGGTVGAVHAEAVRGDVLGTSDGTAGQRFALQRRPVVPSEEPMTLETADGDGGVHVWEQVDHFALSGADDRHFRVDPVAGEVQFGPAIRQPDGTLTQYGAVPVKGTRLEASAYRTGGGRRGNVAVGQVRVLKTSVPYVARVENRVPAIGGGDGETVAEAKVRGPVVLRTRGRAVTIEDFEELAREVAPDAARLHCIGAEGEPDAGGVRLIVVPHVTADELGRIVRDDLDPPTAMMTRITSHLDARRLVGTRLLVEPPEYLWLTVVASVSALERFAPGDVQPAVLRALYRFLDPLLGGSDGAGWPFGRTVRAHEIQAAIAQAPGIDPAEEVSVTLFPVEAGSGRRMSPVDRLELPRRGLVYSYDHQVQVRR